MVSEEDFYIKWRKYLRRNASPPNGDKIVYPDEFESDQCVFIVLDDVPSQVSHAPVCCAGRLHSSRACESWRETFSEEEVTKDVYT